MRVEKIIYGYPDSRLAGYSFADYLLSFALK